MTAQPDTRLLQGQSLTLTLEGRFDESSSVQWKSPRSKVTKGSQIFSVPQVGVQDSGTWTCIFSQDKKILELDIKILVLGKKCVSPWQPLLIHQPSSLPPVLRLCTPGVGATARYPDW